MRTTDPPATATKTETISATSDSKPDEERTGSEQGGAGLRSQKATDEVQSGYDGNGTGGDAPCSGSRSTHAKAGRDKPHLSRKV